MDKKKEQAIIRSIAAAIENEQDAYNFIEMLSLGGVKPLALAMGISAASFFGAWDWGPSLLTRIQF